MIVDLSIDSQRQRTVFIKEGLSSATYLLSAIELELSPSVSLTDANNAQSLVRQDFIEGQHVCLILGKGDCTRVLCYVISTLYSSDL